MSIFLNKIILYIDLVAILAVQYSFEDKGHYRKHISHVPAYFPIHNEDREANRGNMHGGTH